MFDKIKSLFKDVVDSFKKEAGAILVFDRTPDFRPDIFSIDFVPLEVLSILQTVQLIPELKIEDLTSHALETLKVFGMEKEDERIQIKQKEFGFEVAFSTVEIIESVVVVQDSVFSRSTPIKISLYDFELFRTEILLFFDTDLLFLSKIQSASMLFGCKIDSSTAAISQFPMKRKSISKNEYSTDSIKNALSFIMERIDYQPKLKWVGIFRDVPINKIKKITFEKNELSFTLNSLDRKGMYVLDVLVVLDHETGKYYVAPIIRNL